MDNYLERKKASKPEPVQIPQCQTYHVLASKGILYAIITAVLWGMLAIALKVSLSELTPADITWFRFFLAFIGTVCCIIISENRLTCEY